MHPKPLSPLKCVPLAIIFVCWTAPCFSTAVVDSVQAILNGAVSSHQRSQALLTIAYRTMDADPLAAHGHATKALEFAELTGDDRSEHQALVCVGEAEERMGAFPEFMRTTLRAIRLAQAMGDASILANDLHDLACAYAMNGMPEKAVEEARNSLAMLLPTQNTSAIAEAERFLLEQLLLAGRHAELQVAADRFIKKAKEDSNDLQEARIYHVLGRSLLAQSKFLDGHTYLMRSSEAITASGSNAEQFTLAADLAEAFIGQGRTHDAGSAFDRASALLAQADHWTNRQRLLDLRYRLAVSERHWEEALMLHRTMTSRSDSMQHARAEMQLGRLQVTYQLEKKEKVNAELRSENATNAALLEGFRMNNRVMLASLIGLGLLVGALFFTTRYSLRSARRMKLKNAVIKRQHDEIHTKNLEMQRQHMRLTETLESEEQKEMVIKEIHHRVKNNLQVVDSLLRIEGIGNDDPNVDRVLKDAQGRIRSMALVHEHIYRTASQPSGALGAHLEKLTRSILVAHGAHDRVSVSVSTPDLQLPTETLMPLTLVVNELFTNSLKYAFANSDHGRISIVVRPTGNAFELLFSDDGATGWNGGPDRERDTFGLELVRMLAAQLNGELRFLKGQGTAIAMTFALDPVPLRAAS